MPVIKREPFFKNSLPSIIMTVGLPGSGKSTWAKQMVKEKGARRFNKDQMREMVDCSVYTPENEELILDIRDKMVSEAQYRKFDLIIDDCNLNPDHVKKVRENIRGYGEWDDESKKMANFFIKDFTHISPQECIDRDKARENPVGEKAIMGMYERSKEFIATIKNKGMVKFYSDWKKKKEEKENKEKGKWRPTAMDMKKAVMWYYRVHRSFIPATEIYSAGASLADVMVDTGGDYIEVEIKVTKADLRNDFKKSKHQHFKLKTSGLYTPNRFFFCVPTYLLDECKKLVEKHNNSYGILEYQEDKSVYTIKKAKKIHDKYDDRIRDSIIKRNTNQLVWSAYDPYRTKKEA